MNLEARFRMVEKLDPERYKRLLAKAEREAQTRQSIYRQLAGVKVEDEVEDEAEDEAPVKG